VDPAEAVVTWRDLAAAARHRAVRSRVWVGLVPVCLVFVAVAVLTEAVVPRVAAMALVVYCATIPLWGPTLATWLQARRRPFPDRPTRWQVTDEGLAIESERGTATLPWVTLTRSSSWRRGVSLTYGRAVAFIPQRAFRSADDRRELLATAERHRGTAGL